LRTLMLIVKPVVQTHHYQRMVHDSVGQVSLLLCKFTLTKPPERCVIHSAYACIQGGLKFLVLFLRTHSQNVLDSYCGEKGQSSDQLIYHNEDGKQVRTYTKQFYNYSLLKVESIRQKSRREVYRVSYQVLYYCC